jgi:thiamine transport system permease protein
VSSLRRALAQHPLFFFAVLWLAPLAFLALFYFYPLASILQTSFARSLTGIAAPFEEALSSAYTQRVIAFTFWQALLSTLLTLAIGLPGAYLVGRYQFRGKSLIMALSTVPFVLPTVVVAAAFSALLGPKGLANLGLMRAAGLENPPILFVNTFGAILLAHIFYNTTIVLRMVGDFWAHLDPRLQQAAKVLGANGWQTLRQITLPLLAPVLVSAALLVFIFDFTSFGVILMLGGPRFATLEVEIYYQTTGLFNLPLAAALSVIQLACTLALTVLYQRISARFSRYLTLRPQRTTQRRLVSWKQRLAAGSYLFCLACLLVAPLAALIVRSVTTLDPAGQLSLTLDYYRELGINRRQAMFFVPPVTAIAISIGYALATVVFSLILGLPAAWALSQQRAGRLNRFFDPLLMLPLGTSAVTLGLGFMIAFDQPPLNLRASPVLIPIAHTLVALPFVIRSLAPALRSIRPQLRQAAAILGAAPRQVALQVDLPLVGRAVLVAVVFAFAISLGEFGATAMIVRPEYPTVPVMIYRFIAQPGAMNYGQALALSALLMVTTAGGILAIERLRIAEIGEF